MIDTRSPIYLVHPVDHIVDTAGQVACLLLKASGVPCSPHSSHSSMYKTSGWRSGEGLSTLSTVSSEIDHADKDRVSANAEVVSIVSTDASNTLCTNTLDTCIETATVSTARTSDSSATLVCEYESSSTMNPHLSKTEIATIPSSPKSPDHDPSQTEHISKPKGKCLLSKLAMKIHSSTRKCTHKNATKTKNDETRDSTTETKKDRKCRRQLSAQELEDLAAEEENMIRALRAHGFL